MGYRAPFSPRDPAHVHHLRAAIVLFSAFLRTWRAVGRGIFPLFHLTIVLASLLVHVWMGDGGAVGDCNWDDLSSPSNILFNLSHGRNNFPNTSGGSPLLGRHRQWYVTHRIFYALVLSSRYLSRGSRDLYVSLLIISSSHTSSLSVVFRFRSQAWSIRPRGRNISHLLHLHDLLDGRS